MSKDVHNGPSMHAAVRKAVVDWVSERKRQAQNPMSSSQYEVEILAVSDELEITIKGTRITKAPLCACGCRRNVKWSKGSWNTWLRGHQFRRAGT